MEGGKDVETRGGRKVKKEEGRKEGKRDRWITIIQFLRYIECIYMLIYHLFLDFSWKARNEQMAFVSSRSSYFVVMKRHV